MIDLNENVQFIKGVGPNRVKLLNSLGIFTLKDLVTYYPREYEDRSNIKKIENIEDGESALIEVKAVSNMSYVKYRRNMSICKLLVKDDTGTCLITWFNQDYLRGKIHIGDLLKIYGKLSRKNITPEINSPVFDIGENNKNTGKIIPIYPTTKSLSENILRQIILNSLEIVSNQLQETMPEYILNEYNLENINISTRQIHFPDDFHTKELARTRLAFEELLTMQLALLSLKNENEAEIRGINYSKNIHMSDVINTLPFNLTKAQLNVLEEIDKDMESSKPMNRLLQGDVGSRKNSSSNDCCV